MRDNILKTQIGFALDTLASNSSFIFVSFGKKGFTPNWSQDKKSAGFSFWNGPKHFVANEINHNDDGLHFAWPGTISKVDMVNRILPSAKTVASCCR